MDQHPSHIDTLAHIKRVQTLLSQVIDDIGDRRERHDASKLVYPEVDYFDKYTPTIKNLVYGSQEYKNCLLEMKPALDHHYAHNDHHPEYYGERGIKAMGLIQLIEMLVDWKAAGERHGGCLFRSIEMNAKRFGYGEELKDILLNTARYLGITPAPTEPDEIYLDGQKLAEGDYFIVYNSVRFIISVKPGAVARLVFRCFGIDHTFGPAPGTFTCLVYDHLLPEAVRMPTIVFDKTHPTR